MTMDNNSSTPYRMNRAATMRIEESRKKIQQADQDNYWARTKVNTRQGKTDTLQFLRNTRPESSYSDPSSSPPPVEQQRIEDPLRPETVPDHRKQQEKVVFWRVPTPKTGGSLKGSPTSTQNSSFEKAGLVETFNKINDFNDSSGDLRVRLTFRNSSRASLFQDDMEDEPISSFIAPPEKETIALEFVVPSAAAEKKEELKDDSTLFQILRKLGLLVSANADQSYVPPEVAAKPEIGREQTSLPVIVSTVSSGACTTNCPLPKRREHIEKTLSSSREPIQRFPESTRRELNLFSLERMLKKSESRYSNRTRKESTLSSLEKIESSIAELDLERRRSEAVKQLEEVVLLKKRELDTTRRMIQETIEKEKEDNRMLEKILAEVRAIKGKETRSI